MDIDIASALKEFRREHGLEQDDLAKLLETTQQTISNWESGTMPRTGALKRISHLFATYKKGEPQEPYSPTLPDLAAAALPTGEQHHPTFTSTMIPKEELAVREKLTKSEWDAVDKERQNELVRPARPRDRYDPGIPYASMARQFEEAVFAALPSSIEYEREAPIEFHGLRMRMDYLSAKVCAKIRYWPPGNPNLAYRMDLSMLQLISARQIHMFKQEERRAYILVMCVTPDVVVSSQQYNRLIATAALHDLHLLLGQTPEQCARLLVDIEEGRDHDWGDIELTGSY